MFIYLKINSKCTFPCMTSDNDVTDRSDKSVAKLSCDGERNIRHIPGVSDADKGRCTLLIMSFYYSGVVYFYLNASSAFMLQT